jgi:starch phosphorylase
VPPPTGRSAVVADLAAAEILSAPLEADPASLRRALCSRLVYSQGKDPLTATARDWLHATSYAVRDRLMGRWMESMRRYQRCDAKRVYYLSMEFLTGRLLSNGLMNLGLYDQYREVLSDLELELDDLRELEPDAGLGNGGLGRLAACLLDSMASLSLPGYGYGIRYEFGMFFQRIEQGAQVEHPDNWLRYGNPWELRRPDVLFPVKFGGRVVETTDGSGDPRYDWVETDEVMAMAYDTPVPGHGTTTVNSMRLWSAKASHDFDLADFNGGQYLKAVARKTDSENLSKVLYPDDRTSQGRELRLKQQYFFVSASLQDILRRFLADHASLEQLPERVAIQLNDTHPSIAIAELMRMLVDEHGLGWARAWDLTRRTFAYTNHTLMPEALETWPVDLLGRVLPRHLQIIYEINQRFLDDVRALVPHDIDLPRRLSLIDEGGGRRVRMAHLAIVGSHRVNGVSRVHTDLMKETIFADFERVSPGVIINITNGITPRRWLYHANPGLSALIAERLGAEWIADLSMLAQLVPHASDRAFRERFREVKEQNKARLAAAIWEQLGITVDPTSMFDVQVKRIHEYKRQVLNLLHVITRYQRIRNGRGGHLAPRTVIFSGKAAPGYWMAKLIIRLMHGVADVVNDDPAVSDLLKVVFLPNYSVSNAERIIPAADLSEQISTAGTEASGTGNMKLALNGALTIGTLDGANIEMRDRIGPEYFFDFGLTTDQVAACRTAVNDPLQVVAGNAELRQALDLVAGGAFSPDDRGRFRPIVDALTTGGDHYLVLADYAAYVACQERVDALYQNPDEWARWALRNVAGMGHFSSDRTVLDYARHVWGVSSEPLTPRGGHAGPR